jgi:hypothetical protein
MLHSAKEMEGYAVGATDGVIGHVADFDFDDEAWVVRYLVVDTGGWLSSSKVMVSPIAVGTPNWADPMLPVQSAGSRSGRVPPLTSTSPYLGTTR